MQVMCGGGGKVDRKTVRLLSGLTDTNLVIRCHQSLSL